MCFFHKPRRSRRTRRKQIGIVIYYYVVIYKHAFILIVLSVPCAIGSGGKNKIGFELALFSSRGVVEDVAGFLIFTPKGSLQQLTNHYSPITNEIGFVF